MHSESMPIAISSMNLVKFRGLMYVQDIAILTIGVWLNHLKTDSRGSILLFFGAYDGYLIYYAYLQ
jgi:hypothetical protein